VPSVESGLVSRANLLHIKTLGFLYTAFCIPAFRAILADKQDMAFGTGENDKHCQMQANRSVLSG
jgi:hypothetical protein